MCLKIPLVSTNFEICSALLLLFREDSSCPVALPPDHHTKVVVIVLGLGRVLHV